MVRLNRFQRMLGPACAVAGIAAQPVLAQAGEAGSAERIHICGVAWAPAIDAAVEDGPRGVEAYCWGTWLVLGRGDAFRVNANVELGATMVEVERDGERTVFLIRPDADGRPLVEDMNSALAVAAGRTPLGTLDGLAVDYGQFAFTGRVDLVTKMTGTVAGLESVRTSEKAGSVATSGGSPVALASVAIGDHIARDAARLARSDAE